MLSRAASVGVTRSPCIVLPDAAEVYPNAIRGRDPLHDECGDGERQYPTPKDGKGVIAVYDACRSEPEAVATDDCGCDEEDQRHQYADGNTKVQECLAGRPVPAHADV